MTRRKRIKRNTGRQSRRKSRLSWRRILPVLAGVLFVALAYIISFPYVDAYIHRPQDLSENAHLVRPNPVIFKTVFAISDEGEDVRDVFYVFGNDEQKKLLVLHLGGTTYLPLGRNEAERFKVDSLALNNIQYSAGVYDMNKIDALVDTVTGDIGVFADSYVQVAPVDGSIYPDGDKLSVPDKWDFLRTQLQSPGRRYPWSHAPAVRVVATNMETARWRTLRRLMANHEDMQLVDLSSERYTKETSDLLGENIWVLSTDALSDLMSGYREWLIPSDVYGEHGHVEIFNAGGHAGLGAEYAYILRNSCCEVVRVGNADEPSLKGVRIYIADRERFGTTLDFVVHHILSTEAEVVDGRPGFRTTGDIVIVLGE